MRTEIPGRDELVYAHDVHFIVESGTDVDLKKSEGNLWKFGANPK